MTRVTSLLFCSFFSILSAPLIAGSSHLLLGAADPTASSSSWPWWPVIGLMVVGLGFLIVFQKRDKE